MGTWHLHSNSGWTLVTFQPKVTILNKRKRQILTEITISGKYWDRRFQSRNEHGLYKYAREFTVTLHQVLLSETRLKQLVNKIDRWLQTPIDKLAVTKLETTHEIGAEPQQSLWIGFSRGDQFRTMCDRPLCCMKYSDRGYTHNWSNEIFFETDPTGLQIFVDEVKNYLNQTTKT